MTDWLTTPDDHLDPDIASLYDSAAGDGYAVEFAVGTGRIALPLAQRGITVHGIDFSEPMLEQLQSKPGAEGIQTTVGDMTTTVVGDDFALVYLVYNTIMNLRTQEGQVACFANAARHLRPGGRFLIEVMVPELRKLPPGETIVPWDVTEQHLGFDEYVDLVNQILVSRHYFVRGDRVRTLSSSFRYVWPSELDLMAELAGLELEHRWADFGRTPYTGESRGHVSVWRKPTTANP